MISKTQFIALTAGALIAISSVSAISAASKKRSKPKYETPPSAEALEVQQYTNARPAIASAAPVAQGVRGCGFEKPNHADADIYNTLRSEKTPQTFTWKIARDKFIPKDSLVEISVTFKGDVTLMESYNGDDISPSEPNVSEYCQMGTWKCAIDENSHIVLTNEDSGEKIYFTPQLDVDTMTISTIFDLDGKKFETIESDD